MVRRDEVHGAVGSRAVRVKEVNGCRIQLCKIKLDWMAYPICSCGVSKSPEYPGFVSRIDGDDPSYYDTLIEIPRVKHYASPDVKQIHYTICEAICTHYQLAR